MNLYKRHRFPSEIIQCAVWFYYRFNLSHRDIEDLLDERGIVVSCESIRLWCVKFGQIYARRLKRKHQGYGDTFYIDKVFVKIGGKQHYLWRAVDQDGEVVDVFLQARRDGKAAMRFFKRLQRSHSGEPRKIVTDKLRSYSVAHRELLPEVIHDISQYANNRAEVSHQPTRVRKRGSGACGDSNLPVRLSDSWVCTRWFTIYSILVVIWFLLSSTGTVGEMRLHVGQRQWPNARTRNLTIVETLSCQYLFICCCSYATNATATANYG